MMNRKADNKGLVVIVIIVLILIATQLQKLNLFSVLTDQETQLKSEYTTIWADGTDGIVGFTSCEQVTDATGGYTTFSNKMLEIQNNGKGCVCYRTCDYEDDNFRVSGGYVVTKEDSIDGWLIDMQNGGSLSFKRKFNGQEVALILYTHDRGQLIAGGSNMFIPEDKNTKVIFKPHTLEPTKYDVIIGGEKFKEITAQDLTFSMTSGANPSRAILFYAGYKAQFSCDLSPNERWIQTQWVSSVSIEDVIRKDGLIPTKFCKETRPFILRDIKQGETAIFPDPIPAFNRGTTITSPSSNQFIVVNYAVYQVAGLENPTTGTQAYKCIQRDSNYKCLGWVIEEVIKPVEVVVQCKVNEDCPLPLTQFQDTSCLGYFKGCQNNKCVYDNTILNAPKCQNQVVTIIKQIQEVDKRTIVPIAGTNIFTFSQNFERTSFNIGDKTFTAEPSKYLCEVPTDADFLNAPSPKSECWQTTITYGNQQFILKDTQSTFIEPNMIKVQYFAGGKLTRGTYARAEHWYNTFIFTIDTSNAMQLDVEDSSFVIKDSIKKIKLQLINNLPKSDVIVKSQQKIKNTNQNLPEQLKLVNAIRGLNDIEIDMNTLNLGINSMTIQIFYKIKADSEILIPSDKFILNYDIVIELPSLEKVVIVEKEEVAVTKIVDKESFFASIPTSVKVIGGIIIGFLILMRFL